jgi:hypothetical protein
VNLAHLFLPAEGRLSAEDVRVLSRIAPLFPPAWRVGHLWPARGEQRALGRFQAVSERKWDLRYPSATRYDALVAARLGALPGDSERRQRSALASCRLLLVLDAAAPDFALDQLLGVVPLAQGNLRIYRGNLNDPVLRVDDYPTGVRPILEDLSSLHEVVTEIDESGLAFHLGIVPALIDERMVAFLRSLKQLVPSMHGYEHGYAKHSQILIQAGDPLNQRSTVTGFDEFAQRSEAEIARTLRQARAELEAHLAQPVRSYIPPNNIAGRATGRALSAVGFEYVLTERPIAGCELPCIRSDFYDRSPAFQLNSSPRVASLHATWEADLRRAGDRESLPRMLGALSRQRASARGEAASLAERILAGALRA